MTVCYFGFYAPEHPRNTAFLAALKRAGFAIEEIRADARRGLGKYRELASALWHGRKRYGAVIVGFPGPQAVILARLVYRGPVFYNALVAQYDAVIDRGVASPWHPYAWYLWLLDFLAGHLATNIILDCDAYIRYYARTFFMPERRFTRIFQSVDEDLLSDAAIPEEPLTIHYYSGFSPSHGTDSIVRAARLVQDAGISFVLSGDGMRRPAAEALAKELGAGNVSFIPRLPKSELNAFIRSSWACLGLFSGNAKADRAVATKVLEALYCARPVVTVGTAGARELLVDGESALLCAPRDPQALADALLRLKADKALRTRIARNGKQAYDAHASIAVAARELARLIPGAPKASEA